MGFVYKIVNTVNDKVYIGITKLKEPEKRFEKHISDSNAAKFYSKRPLYEAFDKYGIENFEFEVIEKVANNKLGDRERYWIEQYNSYIGFHNSQGYNATLGGDVGHKLISQRDIRKIVRAYKSGKSIRTICSEFHHDSQIVTQILTDKGFDIRSNKKVCQIDKDTDEVLQQYDSIADANRNLGKKFNDSHIGEVCNRRRKTAYGYKWKFVTE